MTPPPPSQNPSVGSIMLANVLCDLPNLDIEEEVGHDERARAYLRSTIREIRARSGGVCVTWQFSFDVVRLRHAYGPMFVVASDQDGTRVWELTETSSQTSPHVRKDGKFTRTGPPRPDPGQFVARIESGIATLTEEELLSALAEIMANRVFSA